MKIKNLRGRFSKWLWKKSRERARLIRAIQDREKIIRIRNCTLSRFYKQRYDLREQVEELKTLLDASILITKLAPDDSSISKSGCTSTDDRVFSDEVTGAEPRG